MPYVKHITVGSDTRPIGSSLYGTCDTAAATAAKVVTLASFDKLQTGITVHVKFTNANTAANPTLKVGSADAKSIMRYGTTAAGNAATSSWNAGAVVSFTYDGTNWVMNDWLNDNTNTWPTAANAAPGNVASASAQGSSANYARQDHTHGIALATGDANGQVKIAGTNVSVKGLGTAAYTASTAYAAASHEHALSIATSTGTSSITLAASTKYALTAGGKSYVFTTPPNTWTAFAGASSSADGTAGYVPAPGKGNQGLFFKADGTWGIPANTNNAVTQTATTTSAAYELLFSSTADNTTRIEGARKTSTLTYNPSTKALLTGGTVNGYTLAAACACAVDTSISLTGVDASSNLPTTNAVKTVINSQTTGIMNTALPISISVAATTNTSATYSHNNITASHVALTQMINHSAPITITTASGKVTVACTAGIPAFTLLLVLPQ